MSENGGLSERERQILRLVATGASNKEIAHRLVISTNTVKVHLRNIFAKISVVSRTEATLYAIREGLVQVGEARPAAVSASGDGESPAATSEAASVVAVAPMPATSESQSAWTRLRGWRPAVALAGIALVLVATAGAAAVALAPTPTPVPPTALPTPSSPPAVLAAPSRWQTRAPMLTARAGLGAAAYDGRIYAVAGETVSGPTGALERYDPVGDAWTTLAPKPVPVADVGAAVVGGRIYVPGGRLAGGAVTSTLEAYDPARDAWEQRAPLPVAISAHALVAFEGKLYLFGGWDGARFLASVYEYDPGRDAWTTRTPMPTVRGFAGAAVAGGRVYVVGGYDGEKALAVNEEYAPSRDDGTQAAWVQRAEMPEGRYGMGMAALADIVHVVGGQGETGAAAPSPVKYLRQQDNWVPFETATDESWERLTLVPLESLLHAMGGGQDGVAMTEHHTYQAVYTVLVPATR